MDGLAPQCAAQSVGAANQLFGLLIQTLLAAQCSISPPDFWPEDYGEKLSATENNDLTYDFIVVGSGSSGSVVASRLSENPDWKVLLLEAGGDPPIESEVPSLYEAIQKTQSDWEFYAESDSACLAQQHGCFWPRGKTLGGSSATNAMFYVRGTERDYNRWAELGNPTWDWEHALKYMKRSEANQNPDFVKYRNGKFHGDKGPLAVDFYGELHPMSKILIEAAQEHGIKFVDDINADDTLGYVNAQATVSNGRRQSTAKAYLVPAKNRSNLHIVKHAHVQKILINEENVATGVEFLYKDEQLLRATNKKEVILSAGAVSSPPILMLSGVGPKEHLEKHNIKVKQDAPVGKNLLDHISTAIHFQFHRSSPTKVSPTDALDAIYNLAIHNKGPLTSLGASQLIAMLNTQNGTGEPDIEFHVQMLEQNSWKLKPHLQLKKYDETIEKAILEANSKADIVIIKTTLLQPQSTGFIELKSSSPKDKPRIVPKYFSNEEDMITMLRAVKQQISFENTDTYRKHEGEFLKLPLKECDKFEFKSDDYLRCYIKHFSSTLYHPVGTSRMSDSDGVVDSRLNVRGVKRLRQIDAGIMPEIVSANTNAAAIYIGERGADFIKEDYAKKPKTEL
ncbi:glucose dehydrogenase [FAD, quinone]-like [Sitodiplosis mosellana]|uniref:glucose dehydrogenase [FAD, quinone]-like n=1 Tax=Sitodiplosis mosellana TaxID=263140 RepID=UPI002444885D|nr:glucose dehydrogenase [FAD, quinone]-like [Sitodiplosis mosellana]